MALKFFCEYCGKRFHTLEAGCQCTQLQICRGMNFPPKEVESAYKVRACAVILARTAGDMLIRSPAARDCVKSQKMGQRIKDWADRAYKALEASTPVSLGKATRVHNGLVQFVEKHLWENTVGIPNLHVLEVAEMYADAAKAYVEDKIESGENKRFWFQPTHPEWVLFDAVNMPLALYIAELHKRRQTSKELDQIVMTYGQHSGMNDQASKEVRSTSLSLMLEHCYADELRSWRYLEGALGAAIKHIRAHGTPASLDLTGFDSTDAFNTLFDYIWGEPEKKKTQPKLKVWLVGDRFWVAAENRKQAPKVLLRDSGHIAHTVTGLDPRKKVYDKDGHEAGTIGDMLAGIEKPQLIGVA